MKIDKLLKRFMKEEGIYGASVAKDSLMFLADYDEALFPFNSFRWETTKQGHNYWYQKTMEWVLYIYDNFDIICEENKIKYNITENSIREHLFELMKFYCLDNVGKEELMKIDAYKKISELYDELRKKTQKKNINTYN